MKERMAGFLVMTLLVPLAVIGYLLLVIIGFCGPVARGRAGVRALDHFVNATVFNGYSWESVSSHAWRARENKAWASAVVRITNLFQANHCQRANRREQPIVDLVLQKGLQHQTIGKPLETANSFTAQKISATDDALG